jgi:hypothetical protein
MLSTLLGSQHSPEPTTSTPKASTTFFAPAIQATTECDLGKTTVRMHEHRHVHMCQFACLVLSIIYVSRSVLLGRMLRLAQCFIFVCQELVFFYFLVCKTGLDESVSPRGDSVHVV